MTRLLLGAAGVLFGLYGAFLMLSRQDLDQQVSAAIWLAGGVVLHDFVLTPVVLLLGVVLARFAPRDIRGPVVAGVIVLGSVTLLAIPVLGRFGARSDNATLLDRDYATGWAVLAVLVVAVTLAWLVVRSRHRARPRPEEG